jgi:hypothetical protein
MLRTSASLSTDSSACAGKYVSFNVAPRDSESLSGPIMSTLKSERPSFLETDVWGAAVRRSVDDTSTLLVLLGRKGSATGWHRDSTEAENAGFAIKGMGTLELPKAGKKASTTVSTGILELTVGGR